MSRGPVDMNFLFTLGELQRLVRAYADKQAARYGITRAQWAVLAKVERTEGLKQSELAEQMEMQPITAASTGSICARRRVRCSAN
jgi:MarR family transcriptional regulator for hemolysin